jgi:hypothetical protein
MMRFDHIMRRRAARLRPALPAAGRGLGQGWLRQVRR